MIRNKYNTVVEVGDNYEYCKIIDGSSHVFYGKVISIDRNKHTFDFERLDNGISKKPTGDTHKDIIAIRGVGSIHKDTWEVKDGKIGSVRDTSNRRRNRA